MRAVDIDRQAIERRDFPITRRGYEPAAVDAHLRALASEIEELQRERADGGSEPSLASTAGSQVQSILAAAEAAAAEIEHQALESARTTREEADRDAADTRERAIEQARAHVAAVAQATAVLLQRVGSMDGEVSALVESLRTGASRLAADLAAVETNMSELYDAASGQIVTRAVASPLEPPPAPPVPPPTSPPAPLPDSPAPRPQLSPPETTEPDVHPDPEAPRPHGAAAPQAGSPAPRPPLSPPETTEPDVHPDPEAPRPHGAAAPPGGPGPGPGAPAADNGDLDSARLIALNMALNGESREEADRYLAENFRLADRQKLIDEVYAAIEG
jgi:hypothetical protein